MNKKLIITIVLSIIILGVIATVACMSYTSKPKVVKNMLSSLENVDNSKPSIVLFYANWCTYCMQYLPVFNEQIKNYPNRNDFNIVLINIDEPENKSIVEGNVSGIPTMYIMDPAIDNKVHIESMNFSNQNLLFAEFDRYLALRKRINIKKN